MVEHSDLGFVGFACRVICCMVSRRIHLLTRMSGAASRALAPRVCDTGEGTVLARLHWGTEQRSCDVGSGIAYGDTRRRVAFGERCPVSMRDKHAVHHLAMSTTLP